MYSRRVSEQAAVSHVGLAAGPGKGAERTVAAKAAPADANNGADLQ